MGNPQTDGANSPDFQVAVTLANASLGEPPPQASFFDDQKRYAEKVSEGAVAALDNTRGRGDAWGKSVLAIGTTLVTALGVGTVVSVFPISDERGALAIAVAVLAFSIAIYGVISVGQAVSSISAPIIMELSSDSDLAEEDEKGIVKEIYDRFAKLNGKSTLRDYAFEALAIERIKTEIAKLPVGEVGLRETKRNEILSELNAASKSTNTRDQLDRLIVEVADPARSDDALKRAAAIRAEIRAVMNSAAVALARQNVFDTINTTHTKLALAAIPVGLVIALMAADYASSNGTEPKELVEFNQACVDLMKAAKEQGMEITENCDKVSLPDDQEEPEAEPLPADPVQDARSKALAALVEQYEICISDPRANLEVRASCDQILDLRIAIATP